VKARGGAAAALALFALSLVQTRPASAWAQGASAGDQMQHGSGSDLTRHGKDSAAARDISEADVVREQARLRLDTEYLDERAALIQLLFLRGAHRDGL